MNEMKQYAVDGYFFTQRLSGLQRFSTELLAAADALLVPGELEVVVPPHTNVPHYQNIRVVEYGNGGGGKWEQLDFPRYLREYDRRWLCTCNVIPLAAAGCEGLAVLLDVCYRARPDFYTNLRGRLSAAWHRLQYRAIVAKAEKIVTISKFSRDEIVKYYHADAKEIDVIYCAWQHMKRISSDETIFVGEGKWPRLKQGEYYFTMANLLKNKNYPWVLRAAKNKPQTVFAIAGGGSLAEEAARLGLADLPNVVYLGYVTDEEAKALMASCKAFLFPTLYEGFGLPPMEALACGAPEIIVSDTPCMREIYGEYAKYIDLSTNTGDVDAVTAGQCSATPAGVLEKYSWQNSAERFVALLRANAQK